MEDGDSDTDKYPHRTGNIAGSDELYGIIGASPPTPLLQRGAFLCFCFHKIGSKGATALVTRLAGRLRTSRIVANTVQVSVQETLAYEGVIIVFVNKSNTGFCW